VLVDREETLPLEVSAGRLEKLAVHIHRVE